MKGREGKGAPSADLLVCFPSRAHLTLMPKSICSPARPSETNNRLKKSTTRGRARGGREGRGGPGQASPLLWAKSKSMGSEISEPTSPKVTCAGQIKVRHKSGSCRSWQSVMEEIERIHTTRHHHHHHNNQQQQKKKKPNWVDSLGFKKDIMHFLTCLRTIRLDFRCFGSFHESDITSGDDDDDDGEEEEEEVRYHGNTKHGVVEGGGCDQDDAETSRTVFSKWFMVLQEDQNMSNNGFCKELDKNERGKQSSDVEGDGSIAVVPPPPPNALLLMRCRSAPAKTWLEEKNKQEEQQRQQQQQEEEEEEEDDENGGGGEEKEEKKGRSLRCLMEEEKRKSKAESLVVMRYEADLYSNISSDIAKETWIVGGMRDALSKSRSWKR